MTRVSLQNIQLLKLILAKYSGFSGCESQLLQNWFKEEFSCCFL